jgi:CO/xanthine dehydrogenase Mo-binding subunit
LLRTHVGGDVVDVARCRSMVERNRGEAKGIGEIGTTGVAAAVANAVFHATGVRVRDVPITLDKLQ